MLRLIVDGMSCGHCVASVTEAVKGVDPAAEVRVDLAAKTVEAQTQADPAGVSAAIAAAGYAPRPAG
jgi:copper chaperone